MASSLQTMRRFSFAMSQPSVTQLHGVREQQGGKQSRMYRRSLLSGRFKSACAACASRVVASHLICLMMALNGHLFLFTLICVLLVTQSRPGDALLRVPEPGAPEQQCAQPAPVPAAGGARLAARRAPPAGRRHRKGAASDTYFFMRYSCTVPGKSIHGSVLLCQSRPHCTRDTRSPTLRA